ncbi:MAG: hypothetical protein QM773_10790 [Hyphomonadaceae bacterium]
MAEDARAFPSDGERQLTTAHAFAAMASFLEAWWERGGRPDDSLVNLLSWIRPDVWADGAPNDPAMWADWLDAVERTQPNVKVD